jgi:hypothetical protein
MFGHVHPRDAVQREGEAGAFGKYALHPVERVASLDVSPNSLASGSDLR